MCNGSELKGQLQPELIRIAGLRLDSLPESAECRQFSNATNRSATAGRWILSARVCSAHRSNPSDRLSRRRRDAHDCNRCRGRWAPAGETPDMSVPIFSAGSELAQEEFLDQAVGHASTSTKQGALQHQCRAAIRLWIVGIRESA